MKRRARGPVHGDRPAQYGNASGAFTVAHYIFGPEAAK